jgi:hypothetical protein
VRYAGRLGRCSLNLHGSIPQCGSQPRQPFAFDKSRFGVQTLTVTRPASQRERLRAYIDALTRHVVLSLGLSAHDCRREWNWLPAMQTQNSTVTILRSLNHNGPHFDESASMPEGDTENSLVEGRSPVEVLRVRRQRFVAGIFG